MSIITYVICDGCGDRVADYDSALNEWAETEENDDYCPKCAAQSRTEGLGDGISEG